jgi:hypothetical protein
MLIATADEILRKGLEMGGFDLRQQQSVKPTTCLKWFRALYGSNPIVYAQIIEDLQTTHSFVSSTDIPMSLALSEDVLQGQKQRRGIWDIHSLLV